MGAVNERLDEEELADWRAGRNAVYQLAALTVGARLAVAEAAQMAVTLEGGYDVFELLRIVRCPQSVDRVLDGLLRYDQGRKHLCPDRSRRTKTRNRAAEDKAPGGNDHD